MCITGHGSHEGKFSMVFGVGHKDSLTNEKAAKLEAKGLLAVALVVDKIGSSTQEHILLGLDGLRPILKKNCAEAMQRLAASGLPIDYHLLSTPTYSRMFLERFAEQDLFEGKPHPLTIVPIGVEYDPLKLVLAIGSFAHILIGRHHDVGYFISYVISLLHAFFFFSSFTTRSCSSKIKAPCSPTIRVRAPT